MSSSVVICDVFYFVISVAPEKLGWRGNGSLLASHSISRFVERQIGVWSGHFLVAYGWSFQATAGKAIERIDTELVIVPMFVVIDAARYSPEISYDLKCSGHVWNGYQRKQIAPLLKERNMLGERHLVKFVTPIPDAHQFFRKNCDNIDRQKAL